MREKKRGAARCSRSSRRLAERRQICGTETRRRSLSCSPRASDVGCRCSSNCATPASQKDAAGESVNCVHVRVVTTETRRLARATILAPPRARDTCRPTPIGGRTSSPSAATPARAAACGRGRTRRATPAARSRPTRRSRTFSRAARAAAARARSMYMTSSVTSATTTRPATTTRRRRAPPSRRDVCSSGEGARRDQTLFAGTSRSNALRDFVRTRVSWSNALSGDTRVAVKRSPRGRARHRQARSATS